MIIISPMLTTDWEAVKKIYEEGIATGNATFQQTAPAWQEWDRAHIASCRLVAKDNDTVAGWAALSPVSVRPVYAGVAEVSIYIAMQERGKGIGSLLMQSLVASSEQNGFWTLQAGIFPENKASISLHLKSGFRIVGRRERIGKMKNTWRDNVFLERRSRIAGVG